MRLLTPRVRILVAADMGGRLQLRVPVAITTSAGGGCRQEKVCTPEAIHPAHSDFHQGRCDLIGQDRELRGRTLPALSRAWSTADSACSSGVKAGTWTQPLTACWSPLRDLLTGVPTHTVLPQAADGVASATVPTACGVTWPSGTPPSTAGATFFLASRSGGLGF